MSGGGSRGFQGVSRGRLGGMSFVGRNKNTLRLVEWMTRHQDGVKLWTGLYIH